MDKRQRRRGKRGGKNQRIHTNHEIESRDIHSRIRGTASHNLHGRSVTALIAEAGIYSQYSDIAETATDHVVPRQSLTRQQLLEFFPQRVETEDVRSRQLDHATGKMVEVTDKRVVWRSDRTLLNRTKPFEQIGTFKREGSVSVGLNTRKFRVTEPEVPTALDETVIGIAADDDQTIE